MFIRVPLHHSIVFIGMAFLVFLLLLFVPAGPLRSEPVSASEGEDSVSAIEQQKSFSGSLAEQLRCHFEQLAAAQPTGNTARNQLARLYASREYRPVWTRRSMVVELIGVIDDVERDGLLPIDYHIREIKGFLTTPPATVEQQLRYELLLSDAFLTIANHLRFGKVDPESLNPSWNLGDSARRMALEYRLQNAIAEHRVKSVLDEIRPRNPKYEQLKEALARYRAIVKAGGWKVIPEGGGALGKGAQGSRVSLLRARLLDSGDLAVKDAAGTTVFTSSMAEAVKRFQRRNGLEVDGVAGLATIREMNISAARRVEQIRLNLERYRWFINDIEPTYLMINIAGFSLQYIENGQYRWETRVIVGQPYRETPVFKADMRYIVFNPQWVVPPTILAKDALPAIRQDLSYLSRKKLVVIDSGGRVVNPASINWAQYSAANFPYRLQQLAGDHSALGRIKFMMPNKHLIYLHDTPTKDLFERSSRTFSSGCIRVENPFRLAELVLQDTVRWSKRRIEESIATGKTSTVTLSRRIPVFLLYLTAVAEDTGVMFRHDIYGRDDRLLQALNAPVPEYRIAGCIGQ